MVNTMKDVKSEDILSLEIFNNIKKDTVDELVRIGRKKF